MSKEKSKRYAMMIFKVEIEDSDTSDQIEEKMFHEVDSYLDVIGIRMDCIKIINESATVKRAKVVKIEVKRIVDENPDLSFLETTPEYHYGKNGSNWKHVPEEDIQRIINQYGSIWNACVAYAKQDKERLDAYNRGAWEMIGVITVATIHIPVDDDTVKIQTIDSGGLFGIESDSDDSYIQDIGRDQIAEVKNYLRILCVNGVDDCEIITG